jgi:type III restriction enzyme
VLVKTAFEQFYKHYEEDFKTRRHSNRGRATDQLEMEDSPPVFIVVCNNTSVSKEVFKYIAGYEQAGPPGRCATPGGAWSLPAPL